MAVFEHLTPMDKKMPFGKYKDWTLQEILDEDAAYLEWLVREQAIRDPTLKKAVDELVASSEWQEAYESQNPYECHECGFRTSKAHLIDDDQMGCVRCNN